MRLSIAALLACLLAAAMVAAAPAATVAAPRSAAGEKSLDAIMDRALELPPPKPRYAESLKFGVRGVTFQCLALSPSNPKTFYVGSYDGFAFASHDGGLSWEEGRLVTGRAQFFGAIRPSPAPSGAPFGVSQIVDGIGSQSGAKHGYPSFDMGSLFSFPYGTTGARILLDFRLNGALMGSEIQSSGNRRRISVRAIGEDEICKVEFIKNGEIVYHEKTDSAEVSLEWEDPDPQDRETDFYYARISQIDGHAAWSSPIWLLPEGYAAAKKG